MTLEIQSYYWTDTKMGLGQTGMHIPFMQSMSVQHNNSFTYLFVQPTYVCTQSIDVQHTNTYTPFFSAKLCMHILVIQSIVA